MPGGNTSLILSKSFRDIKVEDSLFCNGITVVPLCGSIFRFFVKETCLFLSNTTISKAMMSHDTICTRLLPGQCASIVKLVNKCVFYWRRLVFVVFLLCVCGFICASCICMSLLGWSPRRPASPIPPAALISLLNFFLSLRFSHIQVCSFLILQDWHLPLLHNTYQMRDVTGADEEKEEDESPIYHISILSQWIIEKHDRLTGVAWSCVCWLFFGRLSLFAMLHNLFAPLPAWHQPVHLFVCLPPGSRLLLPTAST